jgi:hypothetical protein
VNRRSKPTVFIVSLLAMAAAEADDETLVLPATTAKTYGATAAAKTAAVASKRAPLDLSMGDTNRFLDPILLNAPAAEELEEIIVNGRRPEPLPEHRVMPRNLGAIIYAVTNPAQAWRVLVPDPNLVIPLRSPDDVREPPGAFRGRILEPGAIYD